MDIGKAKINGVDYRNAEYAYFNIYAKASCANIHLLKRTIILALFVCD